MVKFAMRVCAFTLVLLVVVTSSVVAQVDTDGDGLLDVLDATGFDANASGNLTLDDLGIQDLDGANLLTNGEWLFLRGNQITSIERGDFDGLTNLLDLRLSGNQITSIESGDFSGLTYLASLTLTGNQITSIESGDFSGLTYLESLTLTGNQITSIESGDFADLPNLRGLVFDWNGITSIESGDFANQLNLESLILSNNAITSIESGDFDGLTNLRFLSLHSNHITSIESGDFDGLTNLQGLNLLNNGITSIERGDFGGLNSLQSLSLPSNQITSIERGDFDGLNSLQKLSLSQNHITSIEGGAFAGLTHLEFLMLNGNDLTELNFAGATFQELGNPVSGVFVREDHLIIDSDKITALILDDATLNLISLNEIVSDATAISDASLVGLTFSHENPTDLSSLLGIESLDNLTVDQELFDMYADELNAFDTIDGNTVTVVPLGDCDKDKSLSASDLSCVYTIRSRDAVLTALNTLPGDFDGDGDVGFADFLVLSVNFGQASGSYADGNIDLQDGVGFPDLLILSASFGNANEAAAVPEPAGCCVMLLGVSVLLMGRRRSLR